MKENSSIADHYQYGKRLVKHKIYVVGAGRKIGAPLWTLLKHDLSKFRPSEWKPYVDYWQGPKGVKGTNDPEVLQKFREAAQLHYTRNMHHAHKLGLPEPRKNQLEAVADWYSTGKANATDPYPTFGEWIRTQSPVAEQKLTLLGVDTEKIAKKAQVVFEKYAASLRKLVKIKKRSIADTINQYDMLLHNKVIGELWVDKATQTVTHSSVNEKFKGMGLGKKLYGTALHQEPYLLPDHIQTSDAEHIWTSLKRRYKNIKQGKQTGVTK